MLKYRGQPIFWRNLITLLGLVIVFAYLGVQESRSTREGLVRVNGKLMFLDKQYPGIAFRKGREGKMLYLMLKGHEQVFAIFRGNGFGDFTPALDHLDSLHVGEEITVFFDGRAQRSDGPINTVRFIDNERGAVFFQGNSKAVLAWIATAFCLVMSCILLWLRSRGKIN